MAATAPVCEFGWAAPDFALPGVDGRLWRRDEVAGPRGLLVMFICNHCPYVTGVVERLVTEAAAVAGLGVGVAAICANDAATHPADGFEPMRAFAARHRFGFPYLHDESQAVARAYGAVCTPDFFGFDAGLGLQYRGRLDAGRPGAGPGPFRRELYEAMAAIAATGQGPRDQVPSMGCSIKWRAQA